MKSLNYVEFRTASYRNLAVCKELLKSLDNCEPFSKIHILNNTYYLAGYIIEFSYKFALFSHLGIRKDENIYLFEKSEKGKKIMNKWTTHTFSQLANICSENKLSFSHDIPYFGSKLDNKDLFKLIDNWDVQIRYSIKLAKNEVKLDKIILEQLIDLLEVITNKINSKFN